MGCECVTSVLRVCCECHKSLSIQVLSYINAGLQNPYLLTFSYFLKMIVLKLRNK